MIHTILSYGMLPTEDQFDTAWDRTFEESATNLFRFGNDKRVGNVELSRTETWNELQKAVSEFEGGLLNDDQALVDDERTTEEIERTGDAAGEWVSGVLGILGFEWV
jgi:hypothetical protein